MAIEPAKIKNLSRDPDMASIKQKLEEIRVLLNRLELSAVPGGSSGYVQYNDGGAFAAANTLYWDKTNKRLGVNTTTPSYSFHVEKSGANAVIYLSRTDGANAYFNCTTTYTNFGSVGNYAVRFAVNSTARMIITTNGDVAIGSGVTSAAFKLDVQGTCGVSDLKTSASHPANYKHVFVDTDTGKLYSNSISGVTPPPDCSGYVQIFCNQTLEIVSADALFWDGPNNRLGIGTATPQTSLEVNGDVIVKGLLTPAGSSPGNAKIVFVDPVTGKLFTR